MCDSMRCDLALNSHVNVSYPLEPIQLIELPHDYVQLINQPIKLCPSTGNTMRCPAICMVCREVNSIYLSGLEIQLRNQNTAAQ